MTDETPSAEERIERAEREVLRLTGSGPGGQRDRNFRMTVPAEPDRDSDLVLMDGLQAGREALAAARERPSALDVERLADDVRYADGNGTSHYWRGFNDGIDKLLARITETDAGEGTEATHRYDHDGTWRHHHHDQTRAPVWWENVEQFGGERREHRHDTTEPDAGEGRDPNMDYIAWAQDVRSEHEATHGEAEQCGAECIALGLAEFDDEEPA